MAVYRGGMRCGAAVGAMNGAMNGVRGWCAVLDVRPHGENPVSGDLSGAAPQPSPRLWGSP